MRQMVFEAEKIVANENPENMVKLLGGLLDESWRMKKCLSESISNKLIDEIYDKAKSAGAYGGKLAGAGGGGFLFFLVPADRKTQVKEALGNLLEVQFNFESEGSKIIYAAS